MKTNTKHLELIEQFKEDKQALEQFKEFIYYHSTKDVGAHYGITQYGVQLIRKEFQINIPKEITDAKRNKTCLEKYGAESVTQTQYFKNKSKETCLRKYGVEFNQQSPQVREKGRQTRLALYGDANYNNVQKQKQTVLNKTEEEKQDIINRRKETCMKIYGGVAPASSTKVQAKMRNTMFERYGKYAVPPRKFSKIAQHTYDYLVDKYGVDDVFVEYNDSRYVRSDGYLYNCDFYVKSLDLFIELNNYMSHGEEPFDDTNPAHIEKLNQCINNPKYKYEEEMVRVWAGSDVEKRKVAVKNNLNYITLYPSDNIENVL